MQLNRKLTHYEALGSGVGKPGAGLAAPQASQGREIFRYGNQKGKLR